MLYSGGELSPRAEGIRPEGDTLTVLLSAPVEIRKDAAPGLLEIAGADGRYIPAQAELCGGRLLLRADGAERPVHARYAWTDYAAPVSLFGLNGLPLEPFDF